MTRKELAAAYNITGKTFSKWIESLNMRYVRVFTPTQLKSIFKLLGKPGKTNK